MTKKPEKETPDWKKLELLVADIQKQLSPDAAVSHNVKLLGEHSGRERQIDVLVEKNIGQYTIKIIIDCKDYASPVDVTEVGAFHNLVQDVGAHEGVLVCPRGFTKGALNLAKTHRIKLYSLVDTKPHKWSTKVSMPIICDLRGVKMSFSIRVSAPKPFAMGGDFYTLPVYDENHELLGNIVETAQKNWDHGKYPIEPGEHHELPLFHTQQTLMDNSYGELIDIDLKVNLFVERQLYFGNLPIDNIRGLKDEHTGLVVTNGFTTGALDPNIVQNQWDKIQEGQTLPLKPVFSVIGLMNFGYIT